MKIYVINLARARDRREHMEAQASDLGLPFIFFEAADGHKITAAERALVDTRKRSRVSKWPLTENEIACFISHRRVMEKFLKSGDARALILEDDVKLLPGFLDVISGIEKSAKPFDFIDLHRFFQAGEVFSACASIAPGFDIGRVGYEHTGTISYVISRAGAKKFLAYSQRITHAVDKEIHRYWANGLDIYGLNRPVVCPDDCGFSYIDESRKERERVVCPNSKTLSVYLSRRAYIIANSVVKRLVFPFYVWRGRAAWR